MSKCVFGFLMLILPILLTGCGSATSPQPTSGSPTSMTAMDAYEKIKPAMLAWQADAVAFDVSSLDPREDSAWRIKKSGMSREWAFKVISYKALKWTHIYMRDGEVIVGLEGMAGREESIEPESSDRLLFTVENAKIDSEDATQIALDKGGAQPGYILMGISMERFNSRSKKVIPTSWKLGYIPSEGDFYDYSKWKTIYIDVVTGEVLWSDFAGQ